MSGRIVAGAMSGTSADGVDVALVEIAGRGLGMTARLLTHVHQPYSSELRETLFSMRGAGSFRLTELGRLAREIALAYASAVRHALQVANLSSADLAAIAAHGQTLFHGPPDTIQWIDPALLAAETGCAVVSDFRRADCAAGGQGAPLVPFADYLLFRHPIRDRLLLNLGGIANVTRLPAGAGLDALTAFDTGPANCVCDHLVRSHDPAGPGIDAGGERAARGSADDELLESCLADPYFSAPPPKSTDGPAMIRVFSDALARLGRTLTLEDQLSTACALTAAAIRRAVGPEPFHGELICSGGGVRNPQIMGRLAEQFPHATMLTTDALGVPSEAKEAIAFALLGAATLDGVPSNVPSCTGARRPAVLGSVTPRPTRV